MGTFNCHPTMKIYLLALFLGLCGAKQDAPDNSLLDMNEDEFEDFFELEHVVDTDEYEKRQNALKENEEEIRKVNQDYAEGKKTWFDSLNEFSNLPSDEFLKEKTGMLIPLPEERYDEESERYFAASRLRRQSAPSEYNAVTEGHVSPVKNQGACGSCVAFASMSSIETCFKKITGVFGDYSEQQMADGGYGINGAWACDGASPDAYLKWAGDNKIDFASEEQYPYTTSPTLNCPTDLPVFNQGAKVSGSYYTYSGDEELLKQQVYEHGSVLAGVFAGRNFSNYGGGIFAGCDAGASPNHAISVVGYGTEDGVDYWLIKNSWGKWWGDNGYIKMQRGVGMCGIGPVIVATLCTATDVEPTTTTTTESTTEQTCFNKRDDCEAYAPHWCRNRFVRKNCEYGCGMCPGQTPVDNIKCFDNWADCAWMKDLCSTNFVKRRCKRTCGLC